MKVTKILCPVDFSEGSHQALLTAAQLARESSAEVVLFNAWHPPYIAASETPMPDQLIMQARDEAERKLAEWKTELEKHDVRTTTKLAMGTPWDQIVELTKHDPAIDLVVIGTHGRTGLRRALLGSVAEKVVRHAPCPVLVVRARE